MVATPDFLVDLIQKELARISLPAVVERISQLLVEPEMVIRSWDYGVAGEQFPCWTVLKDAPSSSDTGIAYCSQGFGALGRPWGLVRVTTKAGEASTGIGQDSGWFSSFIEAFSESFAADGLSLREAWLSQG